MNLTTKSVTDEVTQRSNASQRLGEALKPFVALVHGIIADQAKVPELSSRQQSMFSSRRFR